MNNLSSSEHRAIFVQNYLHVLSACILYYDHLLTIHGEITYIWARRMTRGKVFFLLNRYFTFLVNIVITVFSFREITSSLSLTATTGFVSLLLMLRIYALCDCNRRVLIGLIGTGLVLSGITCWALITSKSGLSTTVPGCHIADSTFTGIRTAAAWEVLLTLDTLVFIITVYKTCRSGQVFGRISNVSNILVLLILRDGAIYFVIMALANLSNILTFYFAEPLLKGTLSTFASNISVTMMSRLLLNLHESVHRSRNIRSVHLFGATLYDESTIGSLAFTSRTDGSEQHKEVGLRPHSQDPELDIKMNILHVSPEQPSAS